MTLQAYLDNVRAQTGKTSEDFRVLAEQKGLLKEGIKTGQIVDWLKKDYGLGHGHAMAIVLTIKDATQPRPSEEEKVDRLFKGDKVRWRNAYDELISRINKLGSGFSVDPTNSYISLLHQGNKFGIVQVTTDRFDIGIKLKGVETTKRFEAAGAWNAMVTHRVSINDPKQIDAEVMDWLKKAFEAANPEKSKVTAA